MAAEALKMMDQNGMLSRTALGSELRSRASVDMSCARNCRGTRWAHPPPRPPPRVVGRKYTGKVRDVYETDDHLVLVTTDRQSAFDRLLACVPFKGQVLNLTSSWWFERTAHIVANHVVATPHPNVTVARKCTPFRIEFVVRAYLTGTTSTSIWMHYKAGARVYCGHALPDGAAGAGRGWGAVRVVGTAAAPTPRPDRAEAPPTHPCPATPRQAWSRTRRCPTCC